MQMRKLRNNNVPKVTKASGSLHPGALKPEPRFYLLISIVSLMPQCHQGGALGSPSLNSSCHYRSMGTYRKYCTMLVKSMERRKGGCVSFIRSGIPPQDRIPTLSELLTLPYSCVQSVGTPNSHCDSGSS